MSTLKEFSLGDKLKSANEVHRRRYQSLEDQNVVVTVDGQQDSSHLKQLLVLFPTTAGANSQGSEDEANAGNLEVAKSLSAFVKVSSLKTDAKPKVSNIIDEQPKRR